MLQLRLVEVTGVTCEDETHPAEGILRGCAWLSSKSSSSRRIEAVFHLSEPAVISGLDIGNSGSAMISVSVAKRASFDFKEFLPTCNLLTRTESRNEEFTDRVRKFTEDDFVESQRNEKWSQIRVMCYQPYNVHMQFGLSFMKVYGLEVESPYQQGSSGQLHSLRDMKDSLKRSKLHTTRSRLSPSCSSARRLDTYFQNLSDDKDNSENVGKPECDKELFEVQAISYLDSLPLTKDELAILKLEDLRFDFEKVHGKSLSNEERLHFYHIFKKYSTNYNTAGPPNSLSQKIKETNQLTCVPYGKVDHTSSTGNTLKARHGLSSSAYKNAETLPAKTSWVEKKKQSSENQEELFDDFSDELLDQKRSAKFGKHLSPNLNCKKIVSVQVHRSFNGDLPSSHKRKSVNVHQSREIKRRPTGKSPVVSGRRRCDDDFVKCLLCNVFFQVSDIDAHSEECKKCIVIEETGGDLQLCPICDNWLEADVITAHADKCAQETYGE